MRILHAGLRDGLQEASWTSIPTPPMEDVEHGLGGNLCRCGTYMGVRKAVLEAAKAMKGAKKNG